MYMTHFVDYNSITNHSRQTYIDGIRGSYFFFKTHNKNKVTEELTFSFSFSSFLAFHYLFLMQKYFSSRTGHRLHSRPLRPRLPPQTDPLLGDQ